MAKCISNLKNKAALDTQKGASLGLNASECVWRPGFARTRWGSLSAPPDPLAAIGGGCLLLRGRREWEKGRKGIARGEEGKGRTPVLDCESAKVATLKCGGPPTMPEENSGPWSKKFENRWLKLQLTSALVDRSAE